MAQHEPFPDPASAPPLRGYALLTATFAGLAVVGGALAGRTGPSVELRARDVALLGAATFKISRLVTREHVTTVMRRPFTRHAGPDGDPTEVPRRDGPVRQALGELLLCPYCLDHWVAAGFVIGLHRAPDTTRAVAAVYAVTAVGDAAQLAWRAAQARA